MIEDSGVRKHKLQVLGLLGLAALMLMGCGPRRSLAVDPPVDPEFRTTPGALDYETDRGHGHSATVGSSREPYSSRPGGPWTVSKLSNRWKYVIVHHSATQAGGARRFGRDHTLPVSQGGRGFDELGYHFVIGNGTDTSDGRIEVGSRWYKQKHGAHCRVPGDATNEYNEHGIGICLVGNFQQSPPTDKQLQSLIYLTRGLMSYTNLSPSAVHYHKDFKGTDCPGRYFPYRKFEQALRR